VFDTVEAKRSILGPGPQPQKVASVMSQARINFARTGDPARRLWHGRVTTPPPARR
jgi:hypothetical protein